MGLCVISVAYQRSVVSESSLYLKEQPSGASQLKGRSLPCRESSKKAYFDCHIYGMKWLVHSEVTCHGKVCRRHLVTTITFFVPWWTSLVKAPHSSWVRHITSVLSSYALMFTVSLCSVMGFQRGWNYRRSQPSYSSGFYLLQSLYQTTASLVKGVKR